MIWKKAIATELGQLAQAYHDIKEIDVMDFILKQNIPAGTIHIC